MSGLRRDFRDFASIFGWAAVAVAAGYWLAYVLIAPVTTTDSHVYNLARLLIAERGGLFGNSLWTNDHQIVFPWSFDALHLALLEIGRVENLPSFLCLLGIGLVTVQLCREQGTSAPPALLFLLASPTVVFQASTSKNDLGTAFFALAAFYFLRRWAESPGARRWLAGFAIALGMCAGAKSTGLAIALLLLVAGAWIGARRGWRAIVEFGAASAVGLLLWGSVETYLNNRVLFGAWMGPADFVQRHGNPDGLRGGLANAVRYGFNSLGTGLESEALARDYRGWLTAACSRVLAGLGLDRAGFAAVTADDTKFLLGAHEVASNYGLVGLAALPLAVASLWRIRSRDAAAQLAAFGFAILAVLCLGAGWQKFGMRLLLPAAVPILLSAALVTGRWLEPRPRLRTAIQAVLLLLALAVPVCSWNRGPAYIAWALRDRQQVAMQERLPLFAEWKGVHALAKSPSVQGCAVLLGPNDWALPYLQDSDPHW
ncbi:MAG: glycosyltransferase 87 family protein, partial [Terrimicrobiaceae bacterium]|nr:glycosyltransferase 87 family protein [Terrimicrobiaceae bacterium]